MNDEDLVVEFLDLVSSLPENAGTSEYQHPIITNSSGNLQFSNSIQKLLDDPANAKLKAWATIERVQNLF